jgi:hypothetical protein
VFNGEAGQVVLNDAAALHFSGNITVMAWVKPRVKDYFRDILAHGFDTTDFTRLHQRRLRRRQLLRSRRHRRKRLL